MKMGRKFERMDKEFKDLGNKIDRKFDRVDTKSDRLIYFSLVGLC